MRTIGPHDWIASLSPIASPAKESAVEIVPAEIVALLKVSPERARLIAARMKASGFDFGETTKAEFDAAARRAHSKLPGG
jgi:hypothetical protein